MTGLPPRHPFRLHVDPRWDTATPYDDRRRAVVSLAAHAAASGEITSWPGYAPTPLRSLPGLAGVLDIGALHYKDEAGRFGLGSFKALGGAYAVLRVLQSAVEARTGERPDAVALAAGAWAAITRAVTVTTATDGNHGRSVAWGARRFGCRAVIYVPAQCSPGREAAIAALDARVVRVDGGYDDAVRRCAADADAHGRIVVSDTSWEGYADIPRAVTQGYTVMVAEALRQMGDAPPSHVFVQGGVGALAAAVCGHLWEVLGARRPRVVVVEPEDAACLLASAVAGRPSAVAGPAHSVMAGLACGAASPLAWQVIDGGAAAFMTVAEASAPACMRLLAEPYPGDPAIVAGESAVAGLAGLIAIAGDRDARRRIALDRTSTVLLFGTEGATDPALYESLAGRPAHAVAAAGG